MASSLPGNSPSLSSVCRDEPREGCLRAILVSIWITDHDPSAQQASVHLRLHSGSASATSKAKTAPRLIFVRGPFLPIQGRRPTCPHVESPWRSVWRHPSPNSQDDSVFQVCISINCYTHLCVCDEAWLDFWLRPSQFMSPAAAFTCKMIWVFLNLPVFKQDRGVRSFENPGCCYKSVTPDLPEGGPKQWISPLGPLRCHTVTSISDNSMSQHLLKGCFGCPQTSGIFISHVPSWL